MPIAALIEKRVFCSHGGLSPRIRTLEDISAISRPMEVPDYGLVADLLWSDPDESAQGWAPSQRGVSYVYGVSA
jgi:diadenosine tetraphosphatase ApaH/serine/threonine PP2A family protein phosphatase